tara:strand:+ start:1140 stop:1961 length:822 start_codon:yes stop_codon:yes gene_type:complete
MNKKSSRPMFVFIHIEKTAGTTLDYFMINNVFFYFGLQTWSVWSNDNRTLFTQEKYRLLKKALPFIKGIGGHSIRAFQGYEMIEPVRYVTFLRDPIDRYISHYKHQVHKMGLDWTIEEFLNEKRFDNNITKKLSSTGDLNIAIENLYKLDFIGIQEQFDTSLLLMKQELDLEGFTLDYEVKNVGIDNGGGGFRSENFINEIKKRNEKDMVLYEHALKIHETYKLKYKGNLDQDLRNLKLNNKKYRENKTKIFFHRLLKISLVRLIEYLIEYKK